MSKPLKTSLMASGSFLGVALVATVAFMAAGFATVFVVRHVLGI